MYLKATLLSVLNILLVFFLFPFLTHSHPDLLSSFYFLFAIYSVGSTRNYTCFSSPALLLVRILIGAPTAK